MKVDYGKIKEQFGQQEVTVHCPSWGGDVDLRKATSGERLDAAVLIADVEFDDDQNPISTHGMIAACIPIVSQTIVDGEARPFDSDEGRADLLENHAMAVVQLIPDILKLNALGVNADEVINAAKKNLSPAPSGS